ncbi:MAG TPA: NmrA family NAD(P)-binding protein, partial [Bradyrhizobium sp.]|nr:NmrA family NAD(P)-binding protein [Bradyrhizobium sp.]
MNAIGVHDIMAGEMDDPRAWSQAVAGTNAVYHICPNMSPHELPFARALVAAAVTHGVRRLVYHSVLHPQIEAMPHHWTKLRVEEMLLRSGLDVTILQPT